MIAAATTSQVFASHGAALYSDGGLGFSFDATTGRYLVTMPGNTTPTPLQRDPNYAPPSGQPYSQFVGEGSLLVLLRAQSTGVEYTYSNLAAWVFRDNSAMAGVTAFGMTATSVPRSGSAIYVGHLEGRTTEKDMFEGTLTAGNLQGSVNLTADFGQATITGTLSPSLYLNSGTYSLGTLPITQPVWVAGSANFNEPLPRSPGPITNPRIWGTFTGPIAQEMAGGFVFDYLSPVDGKSQTAGGAFIAKQRP